MSRVEILNDGGLRADGRRPLELRSLTLQLDTIPEADGSASVSHGLTSVSAAVYGPREPKNRGTVHHDRAVINVEVGVAAWSEAGGRRRGRGDRRIAELAASIKSTFEPVIMTHLYPRSQVDIYIQVLEQDGGLLQASINATTLALISAGVPLLDYVCACSSGCHNTTTLLDLNNLEESDLPSCTVAVLPASFKVTLVSMETRLHVDRFEEIFRGALRAGRVIRGEMEAVVKGRTRGLVQDMGRVRAAGGAGAVGTGEGAKAVAGEDVEMDDSL